ncbi:TonB-dependent receptor domain-containing protein [Flavobacterium sp. LB3P45]|uniref:TonB-dependent receptor domain-containing protein n=1 Tax=Flavobacterium fructosi TaxID=3230416 RepID=A0ABW6HLS8_9FLAO
MKKIIFLLLLFPFLATAQNTFKAIIKDEKTKKALDSVSVFLTGTQNGSTSDEKGLVVIENIPSGKQTIVFSSFGYLKMEKNILFPQNETIEIFLEPTSEELEEVKVTSTRSSRTIKNTPTRIEAIVSGELEEKSSMQPGNIKMLLTESTGIQTQQTSQVSGSASIRIQGLDGKYTQLLQDGFPLYSGFASGLSILQIPPLNLKRVEIIKGSTSTLYGGGAIAGLINLITKEPTDTREISFLANINQTQALDLSGFYTEKYKKSGLTIYASSNSQKATDVNYDGFSDIPKFERFTINPKFFYYPNEKTTFSFGVNAGFENRIGGDMEVIYNNNTDATHTFFERNNSNRYSTQAKFEKTFVNKNILTIKNSIGYFNRKIQKQAYNFEGQQVATFTEANYLIPNEKSEWNLGANLVSDNFKQINLIADKLDYYNAALGVFAQNNLNITEKFILESGLRLEITNRSNVFVLPRLSLLYKINEKLSSRFGGGLGYKSPTIFSEETEEKAFQNINSLDFSKVNSEKSYGLNADVNYKTILFEELSFAINQMVFYTIIKNPLVLNPIPFSINYAFKNANGIIETKGFETNVKLRFEDISCYIGYTYIDANRNFNNTTTINPLTAKHRINANVMYEREEKLRIAYEVFYVGNQYLTNNEKVGDYWVMGVSGESKLKYFSIFLNLENFLDSRQSKWENMYSGTIQNPQFREVYTPTDGFILNGGIKIRL